MRLRPARPFVMFILGLDHTTSFNRLILQIIHSLMTRQHTICLNTVILQKLITNSQRTKGAKYSHPVFVTYLCRNFLLDEIFSAYDRVFVASERITSPYNSCLHAIWTLVSNLMISQLSPFLRNYWRRMMSLFFGNSPHSLILEPSCLPYGKTWRKFVNARLVEKGDGGADHSLGMN